MNDSEKRILYNQNLGDLGMVKTMDFTHDQKFTFLSGQSISNFTLRYETYGKLHSNRKNAILITHALSGDHHAAGLHSLEDKKPGWWNFLIGPGKPVDTNRYYVICSNCIGGCQGSTGPQSTDPKTKKSYGISFPEVTIDDMVEAQARLIEDLGIEQLFAVIGGSMGGMNAIQWGISYPERVKKLLPMATTGRQSAQVIAFNEVGRTAIRKDPNWNQGRYNAKKGPQFGLSIARMMAHITYLSDQGLEDKFGRDRPSGWENGTFMDVEFEVESYLRYQGQNFVNRFDANTYLYFTKALDRFDLYPPQRISPLEKIRAETLVVGFTTDWLYPPEQNRTIVKTLLRCKKRAFYAEIPSTLGHDSFLINDQKLFRLVRNFLNE